MFFYAGRQGLVYMSVLTVSRRTMEQRLRLPADCVLHGSFRCGDTLGVCRCLQLWGGGSLGGNLGKIERS